MNLKKFWKILSQKLASVCQVVSKWFLNKAIQIILFLSVPVKERTNILPDDFFKYQKHSHEEKVPWGQSCGPCNEKREKCGNATFR